MLGPVGKGSPREAAGVVPMERDYPEFGNGVLPMTQPELKVDG